MNHFYVTLASDSSGYYLPHIKIANFRTKLAIHIVLEPDKWEVGLVEISNRIGYKNRLLYNILCLDSTQIKFPLKHYESFYDLIANLARNFKSYNRKE